MTYNATELSIQGGEPVELYEFVVDTVTYRFTSRDEDYDYAGHTYSSLDPLTRTEIEDTGEIAKNDLTVSAPRDFVIAEMFRIVPPSSVVQFTLWEVHGSDGAQERIVKWRGRVLNAEWSNEEAKLTCQSVFTSLKQFGLRRLYSRQCPHVLYGPECRADQPSKKLTAVVLSIDGLILHVPDADALADHWFDGGWIEWERSPGVVERRAIRDHVGDELVMTHQILGFEAGVTIDIFPGCDHTVATCQSKFANVENYGGFPYVPRKNPFGGGTVF